MFNSWKSVKLAWAYVIRNLNILVWTVSFFFPWTSLFLSHLWTLMEPQVVCSVLWHNQNLGPLLYKKQNSCGEGVKIPRILDVSPLKNPLNTRLTLPTYWVSGPVYSSSRKNWFHIQPRLVRCNVFPSFSDTPVILSLCECLLVLFWDGVTWTT